MAAGLDYGMGQTNIDHANGIRYGVISANGDILQAWADSSEPDYGDPTCPKCGNEARFRSVEPADGAQAPDTDDYDQADHECPDYVCDSCRYMFGGESAYGDEPIGFTLNDREYSAESCLDSDVMITRSPFYTFARFCSPCVPGAGDLNNPDPDGIKAYCFGPDWYADDNGDEYVPFPIYSVADDTLVAAATVQPEE
jgi:hypothetical protein